MSIIFHTNRSTFEVDEEKKLIRRTAGINTATPPFSDAPGWIQYDEILNLDIGQRAVICWPGGCKDGWPELMTGTIRKLSRE